MNTFDKLTKLRDNFNKELLKEYFRTASRNFKPSDEEGHVLKDDNFTDGEKIGDIKLNDDESIVIYAFKVKSQLTERSSKRRQYEHSKKILKLSDNIGYSGGIFVYYDEFQNFRFSFIYPEYKGTQREWSHYKRFTYYVGKGEPNRTFIEYVGSCDYSSIKSIKEAFSVEKVTKEFYQEVANWYFWALKEAKFPPEAEAEPSGRNIGLIRLITRLIFIWFMSKKGIVKRELFDLGFLKEILKDISPDKGTYYLAILQNLFFATLNTPIEQRKFRREERYKGYLNKDYMNHYYFRHHNLFKEPDRMKELFNDIPFLNGGLFECHDKAKDDESNETGKEIRIDGFSDDPKKQPVVPNFLFFSDKQEVNLNEEYGTKNKKYEVRGIVNILSSYNFTIDENTPVDKEVALDPELLGRVFENLLASYNPETATTARKATGSYYTPREIVDYMVRESLKEYFKTQLAESNISDSALEKLFSYEDDANPFDKVTTERLINAIHNLKLLDPAVGSGAFPMGALQMLVNILHKLDPHNEGWKAEQVKVANQITDPKIRQEIIQRIEESFTLNELDYGRKLYLIQNCIYGVDNQPIAIQISKLRFFISLLVDEKVDRTKPNLSIEPLPNLETKFVSANTLIGLPRPKQLSLMSGEVRRLEEEIKKIRNQYFTTINTKEKDKLKKKDSELRTELANMLKSSGFPAEATEKIAQWNPYDTNKSADWFDPEWMFGISDGFDIVIGNPPYIQLQKAYYGDKLNKESNNSVKGEKYADLYKEQNFETFDRMGDIYCLFYEKGISLLKESGLLCYITSNKWMRAGYGEKLREFFTNYNPLILIDLGPDVFENATVDTNILLIKKSDIKRKKASGQIHFSKQMKLKTEREQMDFIDKLAKGINKELTYNLRAVTISKRRDEESVDLHSELTNSGVVIERLTKDAWFIGSNAEQRLKEKIERIGKPLRDWDVNIYRGVLTGLNDAFIISTEKRDEILANCKDKEERKRTEAVIKPILRGRDIKRYYYEWAGLWVIGTFPALNLDISEFPALKKYFLNNFDIRQLEQSGKKYPKLGFNARKKTGNKWFETQDQIAYYSEFEKEKVVYSETIKIYFDGTKNYPRFSFTTKEFYLDKTTFFMSGNNQKYFLGTLNSKIGEYLLENGYSIKLGSGSRGLQKILIERIPIPPIIFANEQIEKQIEELVDKILAITKGEDYIDNPTKQAEVKEYERQIDQLVYELYGLTEEEIKIVEGDGL